MTAIFQSNLRVAYDVFATARRRWPQLKEWRLGIDDIPLRYHKTNAALTEVSTFLGIPRKVIHLAPFLLHWNTPRIVRLVLMHEVAHVLVLEEAPEVFRSFGGRWAFADHDQHPAAFRALARAIGGSCLEDGMTYRLDGSGEQYGLGDVTPPPWAG